MHNTENFVVDTGEGQDKIEIFNSDALPDGKVVMSEDDKLTINTHTTAYSSDFLKNLEDSTYKFTKTTVEKTVEVKGEGTHNVAQTPEEAFEVTKRTVVTEYSYDENDKNYPKTLLDKTEVIKKQWE